MKSFRLFWSLRTPNSPVRCRRITGHVELLEGRSLLASLVDLNTPGVELINGLNDSGDVVYFSDILGITSSILRYNSGAETNLNPDPASLSDFVVPYGINDSDEVVGNSGHGTPITPLTPTDAFLYSGGAMTDLGTLPGFDSATAFAINNSGEIVGGSYSEGYIDVVASHAFLYTSGQGMTDLGTLGGPNSAAYAINDAGEVVGESDPKGGGYGLPVHAFLYGGGQMADLGTLPGYESSIADGVNASGQVVGELDTTVPGLSGDQSHAFLDSGGVMTDLGTLGGPNSTATGINSAGQIVGYSSVNANPGSPTHAFLYSDGVMTDLNSLLPAADAGWVLETATAINNQGVIVGVALKNGSEVDGYELILSSSPTPTPTPPTPTPTPAPTPNPTPSPGPTRQPPHKHPIAPPPAAPPLPRGYLRTPPRVVAWKPVLDRSGLGEIVLDLDQAIPSKRLMPLSDFTLEAQGPGGAFDEPLRIAKAAYNGKTHTITLIMPSRPKVSGTLELTVSAAGIVNLVGQHLDETGDGQPGENFTAILNVR